MHDLVIRGGTIVDGTGGAPRQGDVAIDGPRIVSAKGSAGRGRREIDARGRVVAPGFVDVHTHYDGQATWDALLEPSVYHGVTTVVMGNCGVGFAPAHPERHEWLIGQRASAFDTGFGQVPIGRSAERIDSSELVDRRD